LVKNQGKTGGGLMEEMKGKSRFVDPEVNEKPVRRRFPESFKLKIIEETNRCTENGEIGKILRREGIYWSQLSTWRQSLAKGESKTMKESRPGRKVKVSPALENRELRKKLDKLQRQLDHANTIIDFQKKIAELLGIPLKREISNEIG
jgi:transposase-like protein